ncbi:capsular polysaccharide export protein, LipB/KpsS family [Dendrosporobacter sp. 1207_IL3150]|uniref:capsular polysaccharide export protein, LipB/KpsS family n=1 Tax=Dendrosporobacter sp. 1207_IL3150 TaxID=3084054 RepID=UPI002FDA95DD
MKIVTLGYYGSFSRYFKYLQKNISKLSKEIEYFNMSIYPSAHLYWKNQGERSVFLPKEIRKVRISNIDEIGEIYKRINIEDVMKYHLQLLGIKRDTCQYRKLKIVALKYIEYFDQVFKKHNFDIFICSGDSRMFVEIAILIAQRYNVKIFYFEQGPYDTTIIDEKGVNANSSFRNYLIKNEIDENKLEKFITREKSPKFYKNEYTYYALKILDLMYLSPPLKNIFPIELVAESSFINLAIRNLKRILSLKNKIKSKLEVPKKSILLILQVPYDVQMMFNSPLFNDFTEMVEEIHKSIPREYNLIVREHPLYIHNYDVKMYDYIKNNNILLINDLPLGEMIKQSEVIVVNNSTVGLEALVHYKPLVILGDSYYDSHEVGFKVNSKDDIVIKIKEAIENNIPKNRINKFLYNLFFEYLFEGHFQDKDLKSGDTIAQHILTRFYSGQISRIGSDGHECHK